MRHGPSYRFAVWSLPSLFAAVSISTACARPEEAVIPGPMVAEMPSPAALPIDDRRTTRGDIAMTNLSARIDGLREHLASHPDAIDTRASLVDALIARTTFEGTYDDFALADSLTADAVERHPDDQHAALARAGYLSAVHRFEEAATWLDTAEDLGAEPSEVERARISALVATGAEPGPLVERARRLVAERASFSRLTLLASTLDADGRYEEADATYVAALGVYRDVSPLTLAWVSFARGKMWGEAAGRRDLAELLYRDARQRLPDYVVASTHLSELAEPAEAVGLLERVADSTGDPEPTAALGVHLRESDPARSAALIDEARARYEHLLEHYPEAFLDHGAEFFAGPGGDPHRALSLASANLALRPTPRAYVVAMRAATAADSVNTLCELVDVSARYEHHPVLTETRTTLGAQCESSPR